MWGRADAAGIFQLSGSSTPRRVLRRTSRNSARVGQPLQPRAQSGTIYGQVGRDDRRRFAARSNGERQQILATVGDLDDLTGSEPIRRLIDPLTIYSDMAMTDGLSGLIDRASKSGTHDPG